MHAQTPPQTHPQAPTGLQATTSFLPLMFLLYFCSPTVVINGYAYRTKWGTQSWPLQPGRYTIEVFFKYLFLARAGPASIVVDVHPGRVTCLSYEMTVPWVFAKGSIRQTA